MKADLGGALVLALVIGAPLVLVVMLGFGWLEGWRVRRRQRRLRRRPHEQPVRIGFDLPPRSAGSAGGSVGEYPLQDDGWLQNAELSVREDGD
jgi:hypothetical protein